MRWTISPTAVLSSFALCTGGQVFSGGEDDVWERRYPALYLAFSRSGVPAATISPFCITIIESESNLVNIILEGEYSASSIEWVTSMINRPFLKYSMKFQQSLVPSINS